MRLPEQRLYDWVKRKIGHVVMLERVENRVKRDTPDLYLCTPSLAGWIELKVLDEFPVKRETPVRIGHWTTGQRDWAIMHERMGGKTWLLVQVGHEFFVWDAVRAARKDWVQEEWREGPVLARNASTAQVLDALAAV